MRHGGELVILHQLSGNGITVLLRVAALRLDGSQQSSSIMRCDVTSCLFTLSIVYRSSFYMRESSEKKAYIKVALILNL